MVARIVRAFHAFVRSSPCHCDRFIPPNKTEGDVGAIINMGQEADEPWELHILDHQGRRHRITMETGEMVLYQTDSVAHARPVPLRGSYYDNIFFRVKLEGLERRPVTPVEAALGPLKLQELPGASMKPMEEDGEGLTTEL
jgi:hypothetical protein